MKAIIGVISATAALIPVDPLGTMLLSLMAAAIVCGAMCVINAPLVPLKS